MVANPTELLAFLHSIGAAPKRSLSQNFLIDANILSKIVAVSEVKEGDHVLEIGAGPGALTQALLKQGARVLAIEKDDKFAKALERFSPLEIHHGDVLEFDFSSLKQPFAVVANLPYHLTAPIMGLLFDHYEKFTQITVMVQEEVARRMVAAPHSPDYSAFTLFINFYSQPQYAFKVNRRSFYPSPKVDSAIVTMKVRKTLPCSDREGFFKAVRIAFQQKRKMLRGTLKGHFPHAKIEEVLQSLGKRGDERPENLTLMEWIAFYEKSLHI